MQRTVAWVIPVLATLFGAAASSTAGRAAVSPCPPQLAGGDVGGDAPSLPCCSGCPVTGVFDGYHDDYDPSIPEPGCIGEAALGPDLVFRLDLETGDTFSASLLAPGLDGVLYLVRDCTNVSRTCVAAVDETGPGGLEHLTVGPILDPGTHYLIVDAHEPDASGAWTLLWHHDCRSQAVGACCFGSHCEILEAAACHAQGAEWLGPGVPCDPNPCEPLPLEPSGWGMIKPTYRR